MKSVALSAGPIHLGLDTSKDKIAVAVLRWGAQVSDITDIGLLGHDIRRAAGDCHGHRHGGHNEGHYQGDGGATPCLRLVVAGDHDVIMPSSGNSRSTRTGTSRGAVGGALTADRAWQPA